MPTLINFLAVPIKRADPDSGYFREWELVGGGCWLLPPGDEKGAS
jgi:hypothetical protein